MIYRSVNSSTAVDAQILRRKALQRREKSDNVFEPAADAGAVSAAARIQRTPARDARQSSSTPCKNTEMAQFTLDPEALAGKYEALREDVQGDRDVMHKRIATLEELNKEAHRKYAELQKKAHELQQQVVFAKAGVPTSEGHSDDDHDESPPPERRERPVG